MDKHLLLAIGDSTSASYTLRYIKSFVQDFCSIRLTLFYVAPRTIAWQKEQLYNQYKEEVETDLLTQEESETGKRVLEDARNWIVNVAGCDGSNVHTKVIQSCRGTVNEIVEEARRGLYDAVILGRKGYMWFEEMFENSVCHKMLWKSIDFPIWICKQPASIPGRNVLLCMDGSDASIRMADHVGYMMKDQHDHSVILFHVKSDEDHDSDEILAQGEAALLANDFPRDRIVTKTVYGNEPAKMIMREAIDWNYGAVAVGRHGKRQGRLESIFPSSTTIRLLRSLNQSALWISR